MDATEFNTQILAPGLAWFTANQSTVPVSRDVHVLILAIAGQEGNWSERVQSGNGPAHGFWQFERGGGVAGVLHHPVVGPIADRLCELIPVDANPPAVWSLFATEKGDNLAVSFARLLLWTDPHSIPPPTDEDGTWNVYVQNWRPGRPHQDGWHARITAANAAVEVSS